MSSSAFSLAALLLPLIASLPAHATPAWAPMPVEWAAPAPEFTPAPWPADAGVERALGNALAGIDIEGLIAGFEQAARSAADGQAPTDNPALARARGQIEREMAQAAPQLARGAASLFGPLLRGLRAEIGRDLANGGWRD